MLGAGRGPPPGCACVVSCHPHEMVLLGHRPSLRRQLTATQVTQPSGGLGGSPAGGQLTLGGGLELQGAPTSVGDSLPRAQGGQCKPGGWCSHPHGLQWIHRWPSVPV